MAPPDAPLAGRRLWFVGIGGAGLSAYARLAQAWGADVGGWDRVATPYLEGLDVRVELSPEPSVPDGWEAIMRTSITHLIIGTAVGLGTSVIAPSDPQQIEDYFLDGQFR